MAKGSQSDKDALTGLTGRRQFEEALRLAVTAADDEGGCVSCAFVDVDDFAEINDKHGTEAGDEVLKTAAAAIAATAGEKGVAARYGGDEMAVLLPATSKEEAFLKVDELRRSCHRDVASPEAASGKAPFTLSAGIAGFPDDAADADELLRKATEAMYRAKATGRDRTCLARQEKMVTKTSHYAPGQLTKLRELATKKGVGDALLLREALDDLLRKYDREK